MSSANEMLSGGYRAYEFAGEPVEICFPRTAAKEQGWDDAECAKLPMFGVHAWKARCHAYAGTLEDALRYLSEHPNAPKQ